jgi:hypothetical protein
MKEYSVIIYFRRIVDCESKETLGATIEGSYCIKSWLQGKESRVLNNEGDEDFVPATGKLTLPIGLDLKYCFPGKYAPKADL